jgi:hypothetical protein
MRNKKQRLEVVSAVPCSSLLVFPTVLPTNPTHPV